KADDYFRTEQPVTGMNYMVKSFTPFDDTTDRVEITGLNSPNAPTKFTLPAILVNPQVHGGDLDVAVNLDAETIKVTVHGTANVLTSPPDEPMKDFFRKPPTTLSVEKGTALKLTEVCKNTLPVMSVDPLGATANITADGTFAPFAVALHPDLSNGTAKWHAALLPAVGTKLEKGSDILANPIKVDLLLKHTMPFPADNVSILNVRVAGAINSPFRVPIDVRVIPGP
ncbi:MAG TPA: hypothetical protein VEO95_05000, partial [Chthoniobacteraceae bacterium]|nr:hypothetical protein [Chthoniobacteraceae bacterium]